MCKNICQPPENGLWLPQFENRRNKWYRLQQNWQDRVKQVIINDKKWMKGHVVRFSVLRVSPGKAIPPVTLLYYVVTIFFSHSSYFTRPLKSIFLTSQTRATHVWFQIRQSYYNRFSPKCVRVHSVNPIT